MNNVFRACAFLLFIACNSGESKPGPAQAVDSTEKAKAYFPVLDYLQSEIRYVDSLPVGIMKYTIQNNITDSTYIKPEEFHQLAQEFLSPLLNKPTFEKEFKETSFFDNTTQYSTIFYSTTNTNLPLQRVDVVVKPQNEIYNKVKSVYMEKHYEKADSSIIQKLYWKAGQNFQISAQIRTTKPEVVTRQVKVVWNSWD